MSSRPLADLHREPQTAFTRPTAEERGGHYAFLNASLEHLDRDPVDAEVLLQACRCYISLGLVGPARDLLTGADSALTSQPEVQALLAQIGQAPFGRISWDGLRARFASNLERLYETYPDLREHDAVFRRLPEQYQLYQSIDGNYHVAMRSRACGFRWVPDLCDVKHVVAHAEPPHDRKAMFCSPYLVAGDRLGALLDQVFAWTRQMFLTFTPRIYVIERDLAAFGLRLYVAESMDALCAERTQVFVGPDCIEQLVAFLAARPLLAVPESAVRLTDEGEALCRSALAALRPRTEAIERVSRVTVNAMQQRYDALAPGHWGRRFLADRTEPLRVLGMTSRFTTYLQYSMRDWGAAFEARGHVFRLLMEDSDHDVLPPVRLAEVIEAFKPDLILLIDHLRREHGRYIPANIPVVCWIQDSLPHLTNAEAGRSVGPLDYYITQSPVSYVQQYSYPASQGLAWTMATNERMYSDEPLSASELAPYQCDVSYVSNHSTPPRLFHEERRRWFTASPIAARLIDSLYVALERSFAEVPRTARSAVPFLLERVEAETGLVPETEEIRQSVLQNYLNPLAEAMLRQGTLSWVADYCDRTGRTFHLYGNGWGAHPRFARYARGGAENGRQLRAVYQASTVNLQIIGTGAIHPRLQDGLAAGGFFLIRYTPSDMIHEPVQRYLAALRQYAPRAGQEYEVAAMPELAAAKEAIWRLRGLERRCERFCITAAGRQWYEEMEATGYRHVAGAVFERYEDVAFGTAEEFEVLFERFLSDPDAREQIAASMRAVVVQRYTYPALVDDLLAFTARRLAASRELPAA